MNPTYYGFDYCAVEYVGQGDDFVKSIVPNEIVCMDCGFEAGDCECGSEESELIAEGAIFAGVAYYNELCGGHA